MTKFEPGKCRQKFLICQKHCVKRRKCWLQAFSPFITMFSKGFFPRIIESRHCGKRLNGAVNIKTTNLYKQEGHDGPEIAHLSLLTKHAPSSFPVT